MRWRGFEPRSQRWQRHILTAILPAPKILAEKASYKHYGKKNKYMPEGYFNKSYIRLYTYI